jgi:hypothetical protein
MIFQVRLMPILLHEGIKKGLAALWWDQAFS